MASRTPAMNGATNAHLLKTVEGTRLQLVEGEYKTHAVVVSTLMEAREVVQGGLVKDGTVKDDGAVVRLMVDNPDQICFIEEFEKARASPRKWSVFVKIDGGQRYAFSLDRSAQLTLCAVLGNPLRLGRPAISVYGFYIHAGNAYASTSASDAESFLSSEVHAVNEAAGIALPILAASSNASAHNEPFVLSVGSTPTAHVTTAESHAALSTLFSRKLELHAGKYPMRDLQQQHTSLVSAEHIPQKVLASVISYYPARGADGADGAIGGFSDVVGRPWRPARMSQEHGIFTPTAAGATLQLGEMVKIAGRHACLIAAAYPWYYVVEDGGRTVVDVWVPWKGW
ncbi:hypothetical protein FB451DRAFT_1336770 [Mycena latifolia]|nr:hypothetical protein FB451DRAFT_1336770 [Mycena latifolia]